MTKNNYARTPHPTTRTPLGAPRRLTGWRLRLRDWLLRCVSRLQGFPAWPDPYEALHALQDDSNRVYLWLLRADATREDEVAIADALTSEYVRRWNREPRAVHMVLRSIEDVRLAKPADFERYILPALQRAPPR